MSLSRCLALTILLNLGACSGNAPDQSIIDRVRDKLVPLYTLEVEGSGKCLVKVTELLTRKGVKPTGMIAGAYPDEKPSYMAFGPLSSNRADESQRQVALLGCATDLKLHQIIRGRTCDDC